MYKKHKWYSTIISESYLEEIQVVQEIKKNGFHRLIEELEKHKEYQNQSEKQFYTVLISTLNKLYNVMNVLSLEGEQQPKVILQPIIELWFNYIFKIKQVEKIKVEYVLISLWLEYLWEKLQELDNQALLQILLTLYTKILLNKMFDPENLIIFDTVFDDYKTKWKNKVKEYKLNVKNKNT